MLAENKGVDISKIQGSGPENRIIERDIENILKQKQPLSKTAIEKQKNQNQEKLLQARNKPIINLYVFELFS